MIMTFMMLIKTTETSMSFTKKVMTSIILAMLEKGESLSQVWTSKTGRPCLLSCPREPTASGRELHPVVEILDSNGKLTHFILVDPQKLSGVLDMHVAVSAPGTGGALQNATDDKVPAVDRTVTVRSNHHNRVADLETFIPRARSSGNQQLAPVERARLRLSLDHPREQQTGRSRTLLVGSTPLIRMLVVCS